MNAVDAVLRFATTTPDRLAIASATQRWTYADLDDRVRRLAGRLAAQGVSRGDHVLLVAPSLPEFAAAYYAIQALGAAAVTVNTMSTARELTYYLQDAGCVLAVCWHAQEQTVRRAADEHGISTLVLTEGLDGLLDAEPVQRCVEVDGADTGAILYTSGTTGRPKGAEHTHDNMLAAGRICSQLIRVRPEDVMATALPLFHVFGQAVVMGGQLQNGSTLIVRPKFVPAEMLDLVRDEGVTLMAGVPTMWNAMLHAEGDWQPRDFTTLRVCVSGGASLPGEVLRAFTAKYDVTLLEGWGLTETMGVGTFNGLDRPVKVGMVGVASPEVEVTVRDLDGSDLPQGQIGELWLRGPNIMKGYWQRPEATAEAIQDGWFATGDLGWQDEDGDVQISGRKKELIIRGGYNVYPTEVEDVLYRHPDVVEVAVIGVPDAHLGEEIAAVLVPREGATLDPDALRAFAAESLSAYKVPRIWMSVPELPKGATGKIQKRSIDVEQVKADRDGSGSASS